MALLSDSQSNISDKQLPGAEQIPEVLKNMSINEPEVLLDRGPTLSYLRLYIPQPQTYDEKTVCALLVKAYQVYSKNVSCSAMYRI